MSHTKHKGTNFYTKKYLFFYDKMSNHCSGMWRVIFSDDESFVVLTLMNLLAQHWRQALKCHSDLSLWYVSFLPLCDV